MTLAVRNLSRRATTELATGPSTRSSSAPATRSPRCTRLEQEIKTSPVVNIDETGWKTGGDRRVALAAAIHLGKETNLLEKRLSVLAIFEAQPTSRFRPAVPLPWVLTTTQQVRVGCSPATPGRCPSS